MESQPQNPEFRNNSENFHPYIDNGVTCAFLYRDENSQPFSIRKICQLTPKWRKSDF